MRKEKELLLDEISDNIAHYGSSFLLTRYSRMSALQAHDLRRQVSKAGGGFSVVPKRVFQKAAERAGIDLSPFSLDGHIALLFAGEDPVATAKVLVNFSKDLGEAIEVIGGSLEGSNLTAEQVKELSMLPSQDVMRAQFLSVLEAPMAQTVGVMNSLLTSILYCLENKGEK